MGRRSKPVEINGITYLSLKAAAAAFNTDPDTLRRRMCRGDAPGEMRHASSLTPEQVTEIRSSPDNPITLARRLGVSRQTIYDIRNGKTWRKD